jgi:transposase
VPELIEDASTELTGSFRLLTQRLLDHLKELDRQVSELESQIVAWHRQNSASSKLARIPGIGPITASALLLRPFEVSSRIANPTILEVAHNALRVLLQHRHMLVGGLA